MWPLLSSVRARTGTGMALRAESRVFCKRRRCAYDWRACTGVEKSKRSACGYFRICALSGSPASYVLPLSADEKADQCSPDRAQPPSYLRKWSASRASAIDLCIVSVTPLDAGRYLRAIEPLIAIVLGCMRWNGAQADEVRR